MPPKLIFDLARVDLNSSIATLDEIRACNPQRYEFEQLTAIHGFFPDEQVIVGSRRIGDDEFWVRGHIPGNPVFPGVLQIESAAQLCSFFQAKYFESDRFFGFGGVDNVRFRGVVRPGDTLVLIAKGLTLRPRRSVFACQGVLGSTIVFEAEIIGVTMN